MEERAYGENIGKPAVSVRHADLKRAFSESLYKSICPICPDGVLLVRRNQGTLLPEEVDFCVACGQSVKYEDIEILRDLEGHQSAER